jgi:hypothetical protein
LKKRTKKLLKIQPVLASRAGTSQHGRRGWHGWHGPRVGKRSATHHTIPLPCKIFREAHPNRPKEKIILILRSFFLSNKRLIFVDFQAKINKYYN